MRVHKQNNYNIITDNATRFAHLRKRIHDKRIGVVLAIEIRFDEVQNTVVAESTPLDINDNLKWRKSR